MKKGIVITLAVAIIGGLGAYSKSHGSSPSAGGGSNSPSLVAGANTTSSNNTTTSSSTVYKDGTYTGDSEEMPYGTVQIAVVVSGGKITDVNFLKMPFDLGHSQEVTAFSEPLLKQTTIQHQSSNIDFVSGATSTSEAYQQSLQSALNQAVIS
ncbi:MAG: FMN-binding protein [Candidatus Saccharimonadales bacterium]